MSTRTHRALTPHDNVVDLPVDPLLAEYRRVEREVLAARAEAEAYGGPCKTCRHCTTNSFYGLIERHCHHPLATTYKFDRNAGKIAETPMLVETWRPAKTAKIPAVCGESRRLHERRRNWLQRLIAWFLAPWRTA